MDAGGWTNLGSGTDQEWWVHATCGRPSRKWLEGTQLDVLNFFRGGPLDGYAYETTTLIEEAGAGIPITEYVWTPELITSQTTGKQARVWAHKTTVGAAQAGAVNHGPVVPAAPAEPQDVSSQPAADDSTIVTPGEPVEDSTGGTEMAAKKAAATANLEDRRKELGFSRAQVAEASGLTQAKVYRIEKGTGKTTDEERAQVSAALDQLAAAAADPK